MATKPPPASTSWFAPAPAGPALATSNVIACGPDLVQEGAKVTNYDFADLSSPPQSTHLRRLDYDNHLLLVWWMDGQSPPRAWTIPELRDHLYSLAPNSQRFNFDGGGSSTMWTRASRECAI